MYKRAPRSNDYCYLVPLCSDCILPDADPLAFIGWANNTFNYLHCNTSLDTKKPTGNPLACAEGF